MNRSVPESLLICILVLCLALTPISVRGETEDSGKAQQLIEAPGAVLMDHGKLEEINTPSGLIDGLGKYTVDQETPEGAKSHYFHSREEAISFLSSLDGQCTLRETTLEDVFVERAGRHLMQR